MSLLPSKPALTADALAEIFDRDAPAVLAFFARRTFDPEVSVDLLAETFTAAFADRKQFRGDVRTHARAWIFGIARNQLAEYFRRGRVEQRALQRLGVRERRSLSHDEYDRI